MNIAVFCGSSSPINTNIEHAAHTLGMLIALHGHQLIYGGSNLGLMGTLSNAALNSGGVVLSIIPTIFSEEIINSQPRSKIERVPTMGSRKERIIELSDAFIALPGGIGTIDEISEVMVANQLHLIDKPLALVNTDHFFAPFMEQLRTMQKTNLMRSPLPIIATTAKEALLTIEETIAKSKQ